jgi:hypothetical protein
MANIPFTHLNITDGTSQVNKTNMQPLFDALRKVVAKANRGATEYLDADLVAGTTPGARGLTALASATVLDADTVGGKNLTAQRKLSEGLICAPKANIPEYPDNVAGTTYIQDAWSTTDSWVGVSVTPSVSSGTLLLEQTSTFGYAWKVVAGVNGKTWRMRARRVSGNTGFILRNNAGANLITFTLTDQYELYEYLFTADPTQIRMVPSAGGAGVAQIDWIYIGNGNYDSLALDASGNGNHGTVFGCTPVAGITGRALRFGGNNYFTLASCPAPGDISISLWAKLIKGAAAAQYLFFQGGGSGRILIQGSTDNIVLRSRRADGTTISESIIPAASWTTDTWMHICAIQSGLTTNLWLNGALIDTDTHADIYSLFTSTASFGVQAPSTNFLRNGTIDDPRIYNRALSAEEIWELYQNPGGNKINDMEVSVTPTMNSIVARGPDGRIRLSTHTPATAGAAGTVGQIAYDASYIYICTATNTWKRVAIASW